MTNSWIEHNLSFKDALKQAKETYHTGSGGSKNAGWVRRLMAEKKITPESFQPFNIQIHIEEPEPEPIFEPPIQEPEYDDTNLSAIKNKKTKDQKLLVDDQEAERREKNGKKYQQ